MIEMKNSGVDWIGEIPAHWEVKRIKDVCNVVCGATPKDNASYWDGDIVWISPSDMADFGGIKEGARNLTELGYKSCGTTLVPTGSVVMSTRAPIGKANIALNDLCTNQGCKCLVSKKLVMRFLLYCMWSKKEQLQALGRGTTFIELSTKDLSLFQIAIPPLAEQQTIADYLDEKTAKINEQVALLEKKRESYNKLKRSLISKVVTRGLNPAVELIDSGNDWLGEIPAHWEVKRLKDVTTLNPNYSGCDLEGEVSFVPMESLRCGQIDLQEIEFAEAKGKYTYFCNEDLLVAKVTPCFENGNIALAKDLKQGVGYGSSEIFVLRSNGILNKYLFYYTLTGNFQGKACSTMCGVGGLKRISPLFMRTHQLAIPPLAEQQAIADYLDEKTAEIDGQMALIDKKIDTYKKLKQSLIDEVVTGKRKI